MLFSTCALNTRSNLRFRIGEEVAARRHGILRQVDIGRMIVDECHRVSLSLARHYTAA